MLRRHNIQRRHRRVLQGRLVHVPVVSAVRQIVYTRRNWSRTVNSVHSRFRINIKILNYNVILSPGMLGLSILLYERACLGFSQYQV